ncbi:MAG: hypothetical protein NTY95_18995 [Bacteroidia bacterium]|nr:hypothetical protein [Bacteroidia bacterium]
MKNKTIATVGIISYILSVITSAQDLKGNFTSPVVLIMMSGIITIIFIVMATIHLWRGRAKDISIMLVSSAILLFVLTIVQEVTSPEYGSVIIILLNVARVIYFIISVWVIIILYKSHVGEVLKPKS